MYRGSPRAYVTIIIQSVFIGLVTPLTIWASAGVANNLQDQLGGGNGHLLWWFAGAFIAINLIREIADPLITALMVRVRLRSSASIQREVLRKSTTVDLGSYEYQSFYDRFSQVLANLAESTNQLTWALTQVGWSTIQSIGYLVILFAFDWRLAVLGLVATIPGMWAWHLSGTIYWDILKEQTRERRLTTYYGDVLTDRRAAKEVRLFGLAPTLIERWEGVYWPAARQLRTRGMTAAIKQRGLSWLSFALSIAGFVWILTTRDAPVTAGTALAVVVAMFNLLGGVLSFGGAMQGLGKVSGYAHELHLFLTLPDEDDVRSRPVQAAPNASELVLERVSFTYPGAAEPTLRDISLRIAPGETIALVGENGAGKTTLVKLMLGLYQPSSGRILLDGEDLSMADPTEVRRRLSAVFQHFTRNPLTAKENITLGDHNLDPKVPEALEVVGLNDFVAQLPDGLETLLSPDLGGVDLSGGQWQRLAIARAGIRDASLVALDEPTAALDPMAEVAIFERFAALAADRTTILVSHRLGMARLADRIINLEHGGVLESGPHDALLAQPGSRYAEMWEAQARWYR
jgi:ABC-type multidrug transport system fused ATPase/permease subunit